MVPRRRNMKADALAAVGVTLRAVRDSSEVFPPLRSATATVIVVWEMSKVRFPYDRCCELLAYTNLYNYDASESKVEQEGLQVTGNPSRRDRS